MLSKIIKETKARFIVGVPDSRMKEDLKDLDIITAVDEGQAVAMAVGHYTATKEVPLVYMQSDGLCNALNAITSLVIPYKVPINIFISVRNKPTQHEVMGRLVKPIISLLKEDSHNIMGHKDLKFYIYD